MRTARFTLFALPLVLCPTFSVMAQTEQAIEPILVTVDAAEQEEQVFTIVERMPVFPGGDEAMFEFMAANLKYPEQAEEAGVEGVVYVTFVVGPDGAINEPKILRGIGYGCDEEVVRMMKTMPAWIPGEQRGKKVPVQYNLPVRFKM